jgi:fatty acid-binding protein DegV
VKLTAADTAIVLDSTADFPDAPKRFPNWRIVPLYVNLGGTSQRDYVELGPDELYAQLADLPEPPTTSQPSPGDFLTVY